MGIITSQRYIYERGSWNYKGYLCNIDVENEEDVRKAYYEVRTPQGQEVSADLNPYDGSRKIVEMWIDAGMPPREGGIPWDKENLQRMIQSKNQGHGGVMAGNYFDLKKTAQSDPYRGILPPKSNDTPWLTNQEPTPPSLPQDSSMNNNRCPKCGGEMGDWERGEEDAFNHMTGHYTRPVNSESRGCSNCDHVENRELPDPRENDAPPEFEEGRFGSSYFDLKKEAAGEHPSTNEPHRCMVCKKPTQVGWGSTMCAECVKKEEKNKEKK